MLFIVPVVPAVAYTLLVDRASVDAASGEQGPAPAAMPERRE